MPNQNVKTELKKMLNVLVFAVPSDKVHTHRQGVGLSKQKCGYQAVLSPP